MWKTYALILKTAAAPVGTNFGPRVGPVGSGGAASAVAKHLFCHRGLRPVSSTGDRGPLSGAAAWAVFIFIFSIAVLNLNICVHVGH